MNTVLKNYLDVETERITSLIINNALEKIPNISSVDFVTISRNEKKEIENIEYNTNKLNETKRKVIKIIQEELNKIEKGEYDKYDLIMQGIGREKYQKWKSGFICEINMNTIRKSALFGNIGPTIPIKLSFMGYDQVDVDVTIKEYGINNVVIKSFLIIKVSTIVTMPVSTRVHESTINYPLTVNIVKGEIPKYYYNK